MQMLPHFGWCQCVMLQFLLFSSYFDVLLQIMWLSSPISVIVLHEFRGKTRDICTRKIECSDCQEIYLIHSSSSI